jgi:diguanylate cyclase (GGDEF)-like protein
MKSTELVSELKRTVEQLAAFHEIAKALTSTLDLPAVLELMMQKVSELLQPNNWSLLLLDERTGELRFEVVVGAGAERIKQMRLLPGEGIAGDVFERGTPRLVRDARSDPSFAQRFDVESRFETRSVIAVPLRSRGRSLGVIELVAGPHSPAYTEEDLQAVVAFADFAAIAIDNARNFQRVQELTLTDEHTQLFNARHLHNLMAQEVARATRFHHPLSLVFLDLDRFKEVNDTHGHMAGSALLQEVGGVLRACIRQVDSAFRYGGDEFAAVLIETGPEAAQLVAERIRDHFAGHHFLQARGHALTLTASIGVATFPDHAGSAVELLEAADKAMYRVKHAGRNGVALAPPVRSGG